MFAAILTIIVILYLPGYLGFRLFGISRSYSLTIAPVFSVALYAVLGNIYSMLGIWSGIVSIFAVPTVSLAVLVILRLCRHRGLHEKDEGIPLGVLVLTTCIGLVAGAYIFILKLPRTDAIFQGWDNITHLNLIRSFIDSGNWTSLHSSNYLSPADISIQPINQTGFYPAAWHEVCALTVLISGSSVAKVVNAANYIFASLVYPLGAVCMIRTVFGRDRKMLYAASITSVSFAQFPWVMINFGPLFPNLAAFCAIPAAFALVYICIDNLFAGHRYLQTATLLFISITALGFLQPNAVFLLAILVYFYLGYRIYSHKPSYRIAGHAVSSRACMNIYYLLCIVAWLAVYESPIVAPLLAYRWGSYANGWQGIVNILTAGYGYGFAQNTPAQLLLALMVAIGIISILGNSKHHWLVQTYILICIMCFMDATTDGTLKFIFCAIWYVDPSRVASMCAIVAMPLATLGLSNTIAWCQKELVSVADGSVLTVRTVGTVVYVCFAVLTFARFYTIPGWERSGIIDAFTAYDNNLQNFYGISGSFTALTQEEQDFADKALNAIPEDSIVINNPTDGSILLYGVDGMRCYYRIGRGYDLNETTESSLMRTSLKDIESNDLVRETVNKIDARYVLQLDASNYDESFLSIMGISEKSFEGIAAIDDNTPGFKVVLAEGNMRLYEIER